MGGHIDTANSLEDIVFDDVLEPQAQEQDREGVKVEENEETKR